MNVLFVLYGDLDSNSAIPLELHARELHRMGHRCAVAVPAASPRATPRGERALRVLAYEEALADPQAIFPGGAADVVHAWTPREGVRRFVTSYLVKRPTAWIIYLEDNEDWIARAALALGGMPGERVLEQTEAAIAIRTPEGMPNVLHYRSFIGMADAAVVIQPKLAAEVPPWLHCETVMPGVDLQAFAAARPDPHLAKRYGVVEGERVLVYPGGLNDFTRPGLETLCRAVGIINRHGVRCRLLRCGPVALDFLDRLPPETAAAVTDLGVLPRDDLPGLLALADVLVQPGRHDEFEDLRLPGKIPELLASGKPVVLPDTNIAFLLRDGIDAVFHHSGSPDEIAQKCLDLFADPARAAAIGAAGWRFAEQHFDPRAQAMLLENVYRAACESFDAGVTAQTWTSNAADTPVPALLARRLRLLAARAMPDPRARVLEGFARCIESALDRTRGLDAALTARIAEVESLKQRLDIANSRASAMERSLSWRITQPVRALGRLLASARGPRGGKPR